MKDSEALKVDNGIKYLSPPEEFSTFRDLYIRVRLKENRIYADEVVMQLPYATKQMTVHFKEWEKRARSFQRISNYFLAADRPLSLMDLGCGNGWLAARLAKNENIRVAAVDINLTELTQAANVFHSQNLAFFYGNIFEDIFPARSFDFILLSACAQYFENLPGLIDRLFFFLKAGGEIHIVDSPIYSGNEEATLAKQRSDNYYQSIGIPEMAAFYHHHNMEDLSGYNCKILSRHDLFYKVYALVRSDMPANFSWLRIKKKLCNIILSRGLAKHFASP